MTKNLNQKTDKNGQATSGLSLARTKYKFLIMATF